MSIKLNISLVPISTQYRVDSHFQSILLHTNHLPDNTFGFSSVRTRWPCPGTNPAAWATFAPLPTHQHLRDLLLVYFTLLLSCYTTECQKGGNAKADISSKKHRFQESEALKTKMDILWHSQSRRDFIPSYPLFFNWSTVYSIVEERMKTYSQLTNTHLELSAMHCFKQFTNINSFKN